MELIFSSATSSFLINGVPGKAFHCKRGTRQGDPPLFLFVLTAALLQNVINNARAHGHLTMPIPLQYSQDFPVLQYADGTMVIT